MSTILYRTLLLASLLAIVALAVPPATTSAQESYRVIVHGSNAVDELSRAELSNLLLKKQTSWVDGSAAEPVDLRGESPVREALTRDVHGRSVSSIQSYWQRQIFSGRGVPPPELASEDEVLGFVGSRPGALGYVSSGMRLDDTVKAIRIVD